MTGPVVRVNLNLFNRTDSPIRFLPNLSFVFIGYLTVKKRSKIDFLAAHSVLFSQPDRYSEFIFLKFDHIFDQKFDQKRIIFG